MNLTELNSTVMGLWPKCDWTPDEWGLLADTVKRVPADQAEAMLREVRRTQRPSKNPDMQDITRRARAVTSTPTAGPRRDGSSKWDAQRAAWGKHNLTDEQTFREYWERMRVKAADTGADGAGYARLWHGYCAIDARELGYSFEESELIAMELTGGVVREEPTGSRKEMYERAYAAIQAITAKGPRSKRDNAAGATKGG